MIDTDYTMDGTQGPKFWDYLFELQQASSLCDVQLCVKNENGETLIYPAHKLILAASSRYFHQCLVTDTFLDVYNFDGIASEQLELVVDYMYRQVTWPQLVADNMAESLVSTLEIYKHDGEGGVKVTDEQGREDEQQTAPVTFRKIVKAPRKVGDGRVYVSSEAAQDYIEQTKQERKAKRRASKPSGGGDSGHQRLYMVTCGAVADQALSPQHSEQGQDQASQQELQASQQEHQASQQEHQTSQHQTEEGKAQSSQHQTQSSQHQTLTSPSRPEEGKYQTSQQLHQASHQQTQESQHRTQGGQDQPQGSHQQTEESQHQTNGGQVQTEGSQDQTEMEEGEETDDSCSQQVQDDKMKADVAHGRSPTSTHKPTSYTGDTDSEHSESQEDLLESDNKGVTSLVQQAIKREEGVEQRVCNELLTLTPTRRSKRLGASGVPDYSALNEGMVSPPGKEFSPISKKRRLDVEEAAAGPAQPDSSAQRAQHTAATATSPDDEEEFMETGPHPTDTATAETDDGDDSNAQSADVTAGSDVAAEGESGTVDTETHFTEKEKKMVALYFAVGGGLFCCSICKKKLSDEGEMKVHSVKCKMPLGNKCEHCRFACFTKEGLRRHVEKAHTVNAQALPDTLPERDPLYDCGQCEHVFPSKKELRDHLIKVHEERPYQCDACDATFTSAGGLQHHQKITHDEESFACELCGKTFRAETYLKQHIKNTHHGVADLKCHLCDKHFKLFNSLKRHIRSYHTDARPFQCDVCTSSFKTKEDMKRHVKLHYSGNSRYSEAGERLPKHPPGLDYPCSFCGKVFKNFYFRKAHENIQHHDKSSGVSYLCTLCNKTYSTRHYLNMHINNVHKPKRLMCPQCHKTYQFKYELVRHRPKCKGFPDAPKPYVCTLCGTQFTMKGNLTKHQQRGSCKLQKATVSPDFVVVVQQEEAGQLGEKMEIPLNQLHELGIEAEEVLLASESISGDTSVMQTVTTDSGEAAVVSFIAEQHLEHTQSSEDNNLVVYETQYSTEEHIDSIAMATDDAHQSTDNAQFQTTSIIKLEPGQEDEGSNPASAEYVIPTETDEVPGSNPVVVYEVAGESKNKFYVTPDGNVFNL